jgi:glycosyltransferase involved in cell wall biosynthesis
MKTSSQPLVSIVTPAYNGAEYLDECIQSILAQRYQNWDYTFVDNCSTDGSAGIARRYAGKDPRIRVHENPNFLPVISNHNAALRLISPSSKYCKVVFADDWIFPDCLEEMVAVAEEHPSAGIVGAYTLEGQRVTCTGLPYTRRLVSGREICRKHFLNQLYVFGSANSLLYRANLIRGHDPFYNEANIHADTEVCFALLKSCDFGFVHRVLTFTRVRAGSLTNVSTDLQTWFAGMLQTLAAHGRHYLTGEEFEDILDCHLSEYYKYLGKNLMLGRDRNFWDYHKRKMTESGIGYSRLRLARGALGTFADVVLNPKNSIEKLLRRRDKRKQGNPRRGSGIESIMTPRSEQTIQVRGSSAK